MNRRDTGAPVADTSHTASILNGLLETLHDGEHGFKSAADGVEDAELKRLFLSLSAQRLEFGVELESELERLGKEPAEHGHVAGALHRGWINLKAAVMGKDEGAIVSEAERGEDVAVKNFREALQKGLPAPIQAIIERQYVQIQDAHDHVRSLERAHGRK
ncbi:MAG: ferritin-like domain-containing protein [Gemmatimonadales bacterium]